MTGRVSLVTGAIVYRTTGVAFLLPPRGHRHFRQCVRVEPWPDRNPGVSETELIMERRWPGITFDLRWQD